MDVTSPLVPWDPDAPWRAERARVVLRDEVAGGVLENTAAASQVWSALRRDVVLPEMTRRLAAEVGGPLETVLDLLAPLPGSTATSSSLPTLPQDRVPQRAHRPVGSVPVLRARRPARPGGTAHVRTTLHDDGPTAVEVGFRCSDPVGEPDGRMAARRPRLLPGRPRVPPRASADPVIGLDVPDDAHPGLHHSSLRATGRAGSGALLTFPVGLDVGQEASSAT